MIDYEVVIGVDEEHLDQFNLVLPTWLKHKPSLFERRWIVFTESEETLEAVRARMLEVGPEWRDGGRLASTVWRPTDLSVPDDGSKWTRPQRQIMLAGFVHVPPLFSRRSYVLKIDLDVVAKGQDDWVDPAWFARDDAGRLPAIVSHKWGYTKPVDQMQKLDEWAERNIDRLPHEARERGPLQLRGSTPESTMVRHERIISWCGFFHTGLLMQASSLANRSIGPGRLPVPSQDGYLWYLATRFGRPVRRVNMKARGWVHRSTRRNIAEAVQESLR